MKKRDRDEELQKIQLSITLLSGLKSNDINWLGDRPVSCCKVKCLSA